MQRSRRWLGGIWGVGGMGVFPLASKPCSPARGGAPIHWVAIREVCKNPRLGAGVSPASHTKHGTPRSGTTRHAATWTDRPAGRQQPSPAHRVAVRGEARGLLHQLHRQWRQSVQRRRRHVERRPPTVRSLHKRWPASRALGLVARGAKADWAHPEKTLLVPGRGVWLSAASCAK